MLNNFWKPKVSNLIKYFERVHKENISQTSERNSSHFFQHYEKAKTRTCRDNCKDLCKERYRKTTREDCLAMIFHFKMSRSVEALHVARPMAIPYSSSVSAD